MTPSSEELDLLKRAVGGDRLALQALLVREGSRLRAEIEAVLRRADRASTDDIDEVMQTVWVRVAGAICRFEPRGEGAFSGWLKTVAVNAARSHVEKVFRRRERTVSAQPGRFGEDWSGTLLECLRPDSATPSRLVARKERQERVDRAVAELPANYRQAVELSFREDLSVRDAAEQMSCTVGQFRGYLQRALKKLRVNPLLSELL
jgi:RNA polymerase sigma-70 factor, ECF subfamily